MEYITNSAEETQELAKNMAETLKGGEIFILTGDLGAGKTTFIQGLAKGLGVKERLTSPTFVLMKRYKTGVRHDVSGQNVNSMSLLYLVHIDCYRIESSVALSDLGLDEIFEDKRNVVVIEWGERIENIIPNYYRKIKFGYLDESKRRIVILRTN